MRPAVLPARLCLALCLALFPFSLSGQPVAAYGQATRAPGDSTRPAANAPAFDSVAASKTPSDSLAKGPKSRSDSVIVVKHHFNHREQIITGSVIMTCLALMMVAMNNYNPR